MLEFNVINQKLVRTDLFSPATDSVDYLKAKFTFKTSDWSSTAKTALFRIGTATYKKLVADDGSCEVPAEVLVASDSSRSKISGSGNKFFITLIGEYGTKRITTAEYRVDLNTSGYGDAETPADPTEDMYQQILSAYADNQAECEAARNECINAQERLDGVGNLFANAIKGNLSGAVVFADDVSPIEHNPIVKVHGKNLCSMTAFSSMSSNGASNTYDASTHTITMGADTVPNNFTGRYCRPLGYNFKVGIEYTISFEVRGTAGKKVSCGWDTGRIDITLTDSFVRYGTTKRAIRTDEVVSFYSIATEKGGLAAGEYMQFANVQIEVSNEITDFAEYIDPSTITAKRCGKNLLPNNSGSYTLNGITFTKNTDGSIRVAGTATATTTNIFSHTANVVNGKRYILSGCPSGGKTGQTYVLRCYNSLGDETVRDDEGNGIEFTFQNASGTYNFAIVVFNGTTINAIFRPMLRLADVENETFEAFKGADFTPASDGVVSGMTSFSPYMAILTDTEDAIVECEYIKDSNKVIQKICDALGIEV